MSLKYKVAAALLLALSAIMTGAPAATAAPKPELWEKWTVHDPASTTVVDHQLWDRFLKSYVKVDPGGLNRFDYAAVDTGDRKVLQDYLGALGQTPVSSLNRGEQQAFWINLYNALTVQVVLDHYPVKSIRDIDISPGLFSDGPWGKKLITIEGEPVSLDDVEHRILRPIWKDPRLHYAVNCASVGCPDLVAEAYTARTMDSQLTANAHAYINSRRGVRIDGESMIVSSIYDWFQVDFGGSEKGVIAHLRHYARGDLKQALARAQEIEGYQYDWSLNGAE
ncbi:MAG: DUF547 domain-containing protein [Rhodospirillales bacterium]